MYLKGGFPYRFILSSSRVYLDWHKLIVKPTPVSPLEEITV